MVSYDNRIKPIHAGKDKQKLNVTKFNMWKRDEDVQPPYRGKGGGYKAEGQSQHRTTHSIDYSARDSERAYPRRRLSIKPSVPHCQRIKTIGEEGTRSKGY